MKNNSELLEGNIFKTYISYLLPSIGGMLGISLYVLGDTMIVGRGLGSNGLTALNVSIPIMNIFGGLGLLLGIGGATIVSILKGQNEEEDTHEVFSTSVILSLALGLLITFLGLIYLKEFSLFLGAEQGAILDMSMEYLRPLFFSSTFFILNNCMTVYVRNDNNPKLSMISMLAGTILNVVLDYIFVFIFDWGMWGAGFATALSPVVSLIVLSTHFIRRQNNIRFAKPNFSLALIKRLTSNGSSSFIIESMAGVVIFAFNKAILGIEGNVGVAAYSIIANLSLFCVAVLNGIGQAIQPIISINYGANNHNRVYSTTKYGVYTAAIIGLLFFAIAYFFPAQLSSIFITEPNAKLLNITVDGMRLYFTSFLLMGINIVITSHLQSIEIGETATLLSICRGFIFVIMGLFLFPKFLNIRGVWITMPFAEIMTIVLSLILYEECKIIARHSLGQKEA